MTTENKHRIEITDEQLSMITRALFAYRLKDRLTREESDEYESLSDSLCNMHVYAKKDGDVFLISEL